MLRLDARRSIEDAAELRKTAPILVLTVLASFVHRPLGVEPATVALTSASVMLLTSRELVEKASRGSSGRRSSSSSGCSCSWARSLVLVGALEETGAIAEVADAVASVTGGNRSAELIGTTWVAAIGSGLVDTSRSRPRRSPSCRSCRPAIRATTPNGGRFEAGPASAATRR